MATPASSRASSAELAARAVLAVAFLYLFLVGVGLLESGIAALGRDLQDQLFGRVTNPIAGLCVGILATVLVQSSSVSTATIVGLVGSGLLGVDEAVPMIMGADIGTTVTNTLASLGHIRQTKDFERAFAAATVHDFFNIIAVAILLPLELTTKVISRSAEALTDVLIGGAGATYESPVRAWVKTPVRSIDDFFERLGVSGNWLGLVLIALALVLIFVSLNQITANMRKVIASRLEESLNEILSRGGGLLAMAAGVVITIAVQSSSITTSILVPLAGAGVLSLRNAYPVTLGANVGTTITALLASLAAARPEALTVALAHTIFNVLGILILYPLPGSASSLRAAERLSSTAARNRSLVAGYTIGLFLVVPALGVVIFG